MTLSLLLLVVCAAHEARAEQIVRKTAYFAQRAQRIDLTVGFREMFDAKLRGRLQSGFVTTVVMQLYLYEVGKKSPWQSLCARCARSMTSGRRGSLSS